MKQNRPIVDIGVSATAIKDVVFLLQKSLK